MNYSAKSLENVAKTILGGFGCSVNESVIVADHLVRANLSGHDSHGIGMLPMYGQQVEDGNLIPNQTPQIEPSTGAICIVDAKRGFGHRMALLALDHAIETAEKHNVAVLGLRNSGHVSRAGNYSEYCASRGYISLHFVNVWGHPPLVAPHGGAEPGFSTNPISMGFPVNGKAKPMLDMATSTVALGKVRVAHNRGEKIPAGWVIDEDGVSTTDPEPIWARREGALTAFGNHKGSGLGLFVELLAGALAGKETVARGSNIPRGVFNNMLSIVINPAGFDKTEEIESRAMEFYQSIKAGKPASGVQEVLMPGEPEEQRQITRLKNGIEIDDTTIGQLMETATQFGLDAAGLRKSLAPI